MAQALWMRLREENWTRYEVGDGNVSRLPKLLSDLASRKRAKAMKASQEIWRLLCASGVHSAALPAIPYLVEILEISSPDVQMEICSTLSQCAASIAGTGCPFQQKLTDALIGQRARLELYLAKATGELKTALLAIIDRIDDTPQ